MRRLGPGLLLLAGVGYANLPMISAEELDAGLKKALALFEAKDGAGLRGLARDSHLFIRQRAALYLGRLGSKDALLELKALDKQWARFACCPSGEFGVAVILIENDTEEKRKAALLDAATRPAAESLLAGSVIDAAGRELARFTGDDLDKLKGVRTYGAQYAALVHRCRGLSEADAIAACISQLEAHETPQAAEAAGEVLLSFGSKAAPSIRALRERASARIDPDGPTFTIPKTIVFRCDRILARVEPTAK